MKREQYRNRVRRDATYAAQAAAAEAFGRLLEARMKRAGLTLVQDEVIVPNDQFGMQSCVELGVMPGCDAYASTLVGWPNRDEGPYLMCVGCAHHSIKNRGATLIAKRHGVELP